MMMMVKIEECTVQHNDPALLLPMKCDWYQLWLPLTYSFIPCDCELCAPCITPVPQSYCHLRAISTDLRQ
jgi:hypothetical protein